MAGDMEAVGLAPEGDLLLNAGLSAEVVLKVVHEETLCLEVESLYFMVR